MDSSLKALFVWSCALALAACQHASQSTVQPSPLRSFPLTPTRQNCKRVAIESNSLVGHYVSNYGPRSNLYLYKDRWFFYEGPGPRRALIFLTATWRTYNAHGSRFVQLAGLFLPGYKIGVSQPLPTYSNPGDYQYIGENMSICQTSSYRIVLAVDEQLSHWFVRVGSSENGPRMWFGVTPPKRHQIHE